MEFRYSSIGVIRSAFPEKFGIPRQPGLVPESRATVEMENNPEFRTALQALEKFSHCWIIFAFHDVDAGHWNPTVRPPRLGGAKRVGLFASRSPHRPNPIGISAVRIDRVEADARGGPKLHVSGADFLDGTPVLDIKPYIKYADSIPRASDGWAP